MPDVGRLVEVKGVKEGSGFLIADRLVLTAWHLVQPCPSSDEAPTSTVRVRLERDIKPGTPPEDALRIETRIWPQNPPGEDLDFALLSIQYDPAEPSDIPEEVVPWASLDRWGEIEVE